MMDQDTVFHRPLRISLDPEGDSLKNMALKSTSTNTARVTIWIKDGFKFHPDIKTFVLSIFVLYRFIQGFLAELLFRKEIF